MSISTNGVRTDLANVQLQSTSQPNTSSESVAANLEQPSQGSSVQQAAVSNPQKQGTDLGTVHKNVQQINKMLSDMNQPLEYRLVREKGTDVLQLFDKDNKKVIYQSPPEGLVEAAAKLPQMTKGLLIDTKQ